MNDQYNRSWPGQEPDEPRRAQWPTGDEPAPQWPGGNEPPRSQPQWPGGSDPDRTQQRRVPPAGRRPQGPPPGPPGERPTRGRYRPPAPTEPEPGLLTHSELGSAGYTDGGYDDQQTRFNEFGADDQPAPVRTKQGKPALTPRQRKKRRWRRVRRTFYVLFGLGVVIPAAAFTVAYFLVKVPSPDEVLAQQKGVVSYYYADNTLMGKEIPSTGNRQVLQADQIPEVVKHAVYAAEDASFETNNGFDVVGIMRAAYNNLTGGVGGGSTISQQYIKKATENEAPTLTRKATELVQSFKMNQTQSKQDIIAGYLNIVFFGRGAYGIEAASQAFYGKPAAQLTASEAARLAGQIQSPSRSENADYTTKRWDYVLGNMQKYGWLSPADRQAAQYPEAIPKDQGKPQAITGPNAYIQAQVEDELEQAGYTKEKLQAGGYNVYTTIDPKAQQVAEQAVNDIMKDQPDELKNAFVAVDPKTRAVIAYYGGPNNKADQKDWASAERNPGSSFKAFDIAAFLKMGKGLGETFDGTSPRPFGVLPNGKPRMVSNAGSSNSCSKECTVAEATMRSTNTVFFDMVANVTGATAVSEAAEEAGVTALKNVDNNISLGGGNTRVTALDMASGYATFADDGLALDRHFVLKVTDAAGNIVYQPPSNPTPAFAANNAAKSKQIAGNVTAALKPVIDFSKLKCPTGHECAGKTGTQQYDPNGSDNSGTAKDNSEVWMVGYTPSISAASWVGTGYNKPLKDKNGDIVGSGGLPAKIWQQFMNNYLKDKPKETFPKVDPIGKGATANDDASPTKPPSSSSNLPTTTTPPSSPESSTPETSTSQSRSSTPSTGGGIIFPTRGGNGDGRGDDDG